MTIKTSVGYEVEIEKEKVLDYELSYLIGCIQTDSQEESIKDNTLLLNKLLGSKEEVFKLFKVIKEKNEGIISNEIISEVIIEILNALGEGKKK